MTTGSSCVIRAECVADTVALPRDWGSQCNQRPFDQINGMVLSHTATGSG